MSIKNITIIAALALTACTTAAKHTAAQLVVASDHAADSIAEKWETYVDERIAYCRSLAITTPDERRACLGEAADSSKLEAAIRTLIATQLAVKLAVECEENPLHLRDVSSCPKQDWIALAAAVQAAWDDLAPYVHAARENAK
jgi:hypothetical protein